MFFFNVVFICIEVGNAKVNILCLLKDDKSLKHFHLVYKILLQFKSLTMSSNNYHLNDSSAMEIPNLSAVFFNEFANGPCPPQ